MTPPVSPPREEIIEGKHVDRAKAKEKYDRNKAKRRRGEDDTDRDLRLAREQILRPSDLQRASSKATHCTDRDTDAPIMDHSGHIQLFAPPKPRSKHSEKNVEAESDRKRKEREFEDQYTMRFSNAAGNRRDGAQKPWYSGIEPLGRGDVHESGFNAFGRPDEGRKHRDEKRLQSSDPMAAMKVAQQKLREVARERDTSNREREKQRRALEWEDRRQSKIYEATIDEFSLDATPQVAGTDEVRYERNKCNRRRSVSRSRDRHRNDDRLASADHHSRSRDYRGGFRDHSNPDSDRSRRDPRRSRSPYD